jgi:hypothetical protein
MTRVARAQAKVAREATLVVRDPPNAFSTLTRA